MNDNEIVPNECDIFSTNEIAKTNLKVVSVETPDEENQRKIQENLAYYFAPSPSEGCATSTAPSGLRYTCQSAEEHFFISRGRTDLVPGSRIVS